MRNLYYSFAVILSLFLFLSCSTESTPVYQLSMNTDPAEAGSVSPSSGEFEEGESVEVRATANENWVFDRWQGDLTGNLNPAPVILNMDKSITAVFKKQEYNLAINVIGEGEIEQRVISTKSTPYEHGTTVELEAIPKFGWEFDKWSGDVNGNTNPISIRVEDETSVTAEFRTEIVTDIDGNEYETVLIGDQLWLRESLITTKYTDGSLIKSNLSALEWENTNEGAFTIYDHSLVNGIDSEGDMIEKYGVLYNWYAIQDERKICPEGLDVADNDDWSELISFVSESSNESANSLKTRRQINSPLGDPWATEEHPRWDENTEHYGKDEVNFTALPMGFANENKIYQRIGESVNWWSKTPFSAFPSNSVSGVSLISNSGDVRADLVNRNYGLGVRCVKNN